MAKKKKKGKAPNTKEPKRKRMSFSQIAFYALGIMVILSMLISTLRF